MDLPAALPTAADVETAARRLAGIADQDKDVKKA